MHFYFKNFLKNVLTLGGHFDNIVNAASVGGVIFCAVFGAEHQYEHGEISKWS